MSVTLLTSMVAGCWQPAEQPLQPEAFLSRRQVDGTGRVQPVDQSGPLVVGTVNPAPPAAPPGGNGSPRVAPVVAETVMPVTEAGPADVGPSAPAAAAAAQPAATTPGAAQEGGYQVIGTVLAEVNGSPIYADKVLEILERPLAAEAKKRTETEFKAVATQLVREQVLALINAELEYAIAQRLLGPQEQAEARARTVQWRIEQVTAAGGSEELARKKWAAEGYDFEERAEEEYRTQMRRLYYTKKEWPRIQVRQSDIRSYYEANKTKEFTTQSAARFRVIKVDFARSGGEQAAKDKAANLEKRARSGEDFAKLAETMNDEPLYTKPFPQPFAKGAFAVEAVEDAVWNVNHGEVTPLIKTKDAYYLAQLERKEVGRTIPFEEAQDAIVQKLRRQQFAILQAEVRQRLLKGADIKEHPQMMAVAMDMIMQRYPTWRGAGGAASAG